MLGEVPPPPEEKPAYVAPPDQGDDRDGLPSLADPPGPLPSDDRPPALFELPQEPASETALASVPPAEDWPAEPARRALPARSALVVSIVLGVAAAVIGAAAGARAGRTAEVESAPVEVAPAAMTAPAASHRAAPVATPEGKHGPVVQVASQPTATAARRGDRPSR